MSPKTKNIIIWIISGLLSLAFFGSGLSKIFGAEMQIKNFQSWGYPLWLRFPIGLIEISFAIWAINYYLQKDDCLWNICFGQ